MCSYIGMYDEICALAYTCAYMYVCTYACSSMLEYIYIIYVYRYAVFLR